MKESVVQGKEIHRQGLVEDGERIELRDPVRSAW